MENNMSVVKGKRNKSPFETTKSFIELRSEVTDLILHDFGYSSKKYKKKIERYKETHPDIADRDEVIERLEQKLLSFDAWFVEGERNAIIDTLRNIDREFTIANSIYPSDTPAKLLEFLMRRYHMNMAIGYCYALKQEINYAIRTLPVDINRYERFDKMIDKQISLIKGVRQADNRLIKPNKKRNASQNEITLEEETATALDGVASVIHKIGEITKKSEQSQIK